jgi:hypothetical protein
MVLGFLGLVQQVLEVSLSFPEMVGLLNDLS